MGYIGSQIFFSLRFAEDQMILAGASNNLEFMIKGLCRECNKLEFSCDFNKNFSDTDYLVVTSEIQV